MNQEIERKYLIAYPDCTVLDAQDEAVRWEIVQTYLQSQPTEDRRVRRVETAGTVRYFYTCKTKKSDLARWEDEREIDKTAYETYLSEADDAFVPLRKTRYRIPYGGFLAEIDLYPQVREWAILEIELESEEQEAPLPPWVSVIREVTGEKRYSNRTLARNSEKF